MESALQSSNTKFVHFNISSIKLKCTHLQYGLAFHTPFLTLVSHMSLSILKSNTLVSPFSYPAATTRSESLNELPNATAQQSLAFAPSAGTIDATGWFCRTSHTLTTPSLEPVASSGGPGMLPPAPSMQFTIESCAFTLKVVLF